jgi:outer membrane protein OmpA-like peptidoglycan-associated protein
LFAAGIATFENDALRTMMVLRNSPFLLALFAMCGISGAAQALDCLPVGALPGYVASDDIRKRDHEAIEFTLDKNGETAPVVIAGRSCQQSYTPKSGSNPMSDLEIQSNYRAQLAKLGAAVVYTDDRNTDARIAKGNQETWVKIYSQETQIDVTVVDKTPFKATLLPSSGSDYRLLGHMPNYQASPPEKRNFDKAGFLAKDAEGSTHEVEVQGTRFSVAYKLAQNAKPNSDIDIQENYRAALAALGAQVLFADERNTVARLNDAAGQPVWVKIYSRETDIELTAIEEKAFQASIKPPEASALKTALARDGHVALYVNFDFNKATLKPDAAPVIAQIVTLMKDDPSLRLEIGGHTDNIGEHDYNVKLSASRAASVVAAIVAQGIQAGRLSATGYGADKPVADNAKEEGRAKNRRVELTKS